MTIRTKRKAKPGWMKSRPPGGERYLFVKRRLRTFGLHTVCEEARCPNVGECWGGGTVTVMILGDTCTRACRFCAVRTGDPRGRLDESEPERVARAVAELNLDYVVLTSVDRDDLEDGGAGHFARTVSRVRERSPEAKVEVLIPDFGARREALEVLIGSGPEVVGHNVETVRRLTKRVRDRRAGYERSLDVLRMVKEIAPSRLVKSSVLVGLGETKDELFETMRDLRGVGTDMVTVGQYLRPTKRQLEVARYYTPEEFEAVEAYGRSIGFEYVAAGPLVRSSYRAGELFVKGALENLSINRA